MNRKRIILIGLALFQMMNLLGQRVEFLYDENGNRTSRTIIVELLRPNTIEFPITDPKKLGFLGNLRAKSLEVGESLQTADAKGQDDPIGERINSEEGEIFTNVYPNPNKGLIKIDISNMPLNSINEMRIYNLSGMELMSKRNFEGYSEIDISKFEDGIYILRIKINERIFYWKVVKNNY